MKTIERSDLDQILAIGSTDHVFLSVFLGTSPQEKNKRETGIFLKKKIRQFEKFYAGQPARLAEFKRNADRLRRWLDEDLADDTRGVAVFSSVDRGVFRTFELADRLPNRFVVGNSPAVGPLAQIVEDHTHHCIVLVDQKHGRILSVYLWRVLEEKELREDVPAKIKVGGWSQMRFQRHHHDKVTHFLKDLAEELTEFVAKECPDDVVLLGQERILAEFVRLLPVSIQRKVILTDQMGMTTTGADVVRRLRPLIEAELARSVEGLLGRLEDQIRHDRLAVGGLEETLGCLQEGRVETLVVSRDLSRRGLRCTGCGWLFATTDKPACDWCSGALEGVDLSEQMVEMTEKHRTPIEFVQVADGDFMSYMDGVGAFLKY